MSAAWVAGGVRARAMTQRRLGPVGVRELAASPSLEAALDGLARGPYGREIRPGQTLAEAQRAVVETLVWNVRVLAGWAPREGVAILRVLAGSLEAANVDDHLRRLAGDPAPPPYRLGGLATAWPRLAGSESPAELRRRLRESPWGDPGAGGRRDVHLAMRATLADRVVAAVPLAVAWAAGATALLVAREVVAGRDLPGPARVAAARVLGSAAVAATSLAELAAVLPSAARWALADVVGPDDLWRAEARWWARVDRDGAAWARRATPGVPVLVGAVALLATDAWRVRAGLESAARGGVRQEDFDEVA